MSSKPTTGYTRPLRSNRELAELFFQHPSILAPMEDVTDIVFRRICRRMGADICVTEFVNVEGLLRGCKKARRKLTLLEGDERTAIQIYGADRDRLAEAARVAEEAEPLFLDINCGCWVPNIAGRGAGAGWLREPAKMVEMAAMVVRSVGIPVTVKTRIGWGPESHMPIVDLARRLEDVGVAAITLHCRTASMGHSGKADWSWAMRAREVTTIPIVVNGDVESGRDAVRALRETSCAAVMVGRRALAHPWVFREIDGALHEGREVPPPTLEERIDLCCEHLMQNAEARGETYGVAVTRRHLAGYLKGIVGASTLRNRLNHEPTLEGCLAILAEARSTAADPSPVHATA